MIAKTTDHAFDVARAQPVIGRAVPEPSIVTSPSPRQQMTPTLLRPPGSARGSANLRNTMNLHGFLSSCWEAGWRRGPARQGPHVTIFGGATWPLDQTGPRVALRRKAVRHWSRALITVPIVVRELAPAGGRFMTVSATDGRQMIRSFVDHEHEELVGGIERMHEAACELATLSVSVEADRVDGVLRWVDERSSCLTWPGRRRGSSRRSTTAHRHALGNPIGSASTTDRSPSRPTGCGRTDRNWSTVPSGETIVEVRCRPVRTL